jgi:hypothetical protein
VESDDYTHGNPHGTTVSSIRFSHALQTYGGKGERKKKKKKRKKSMRSSKTGLRLFKYT